MHIDDVYHFRILVFAQFKLWLPSIRVVVIRRCEEIIQLVEVQLDHVAFELHGVGKLFVLSQAEEFFKSTWHDTWLLLRSLDRICLSRACLTIGEDAHVVSCGNEAVTIMEK